MTITNSPVTRYLTLDNLVVNPTLARRLPPALAFRYQALPIAKDNDHITVVMANPYDRTACEAIAVGLGAAPYVVQGDPTAIDQRLAEIWSNIARPAATRLLVYHQNNPRAAEIDAYALHLTELVAGQLSHFDRGTAPNSNFEALVEQVGRGQNLVIFGEPPQSAVKRLLSGPVSSQAVDRLPTSVLVARRPRWPLKNILLITRGHESDTAAVDWLLRLAQPSQAAVTVLALAVQSKPTVTSQSTGLADWLAVDTPLGRQLHRLTQQLVNWEVKAKLRFRQGSPEQQIQQEVSTGEYDLIVLAADTPDWWLRRLLGELVNPLLYWIDRPVLIAKPSLI